MRDTLVAALLSCSDNPLRPEAHRFLLGLSADELQFIAEFLGACVLDPLQKWGSSRAQLAERIAMFQRARASRWTFNSEDRDHKMIVLLEYLSRYGSDRLPTAQAGHA